MGYPFSHLKEYFQNILIQYPGLSVLIDGIILFFWNALIDKFPTPLSPL